MQGFRRNALFKIQNGRKGTKTSEDLSFDFYLVTDLRMGYMIVELDELNLMELV